MSTDTQGTPFATRQIDAALERAAQRAGERFDRFGLGRAAGGIVLVVVGALVLAIPELVTWAVALGAIAMGTLLLWSASVPGTPRS